MKATPEQILDDLGIERGDILYVKASRRRLGYDKAETEHLLETILDRIGRDGTLVMPSFPWENRSGELPDGFTLDLAGTPSRMGLLSEMFLRHAGTLRSEHFWWPHCAWGRHAPALLAGQRDIPNPFGPGSTVNRLLDHPTRMVGLGVTTNYNIIAHAVDATLEPGYPGEIFERSPARGFVVDNAGTKHAMVSFRLLAGLRSLVKPSRVVEASARVRAALVEHDYAGAFTWSVPAGVFYDEALRLGRAAVECNRWPPWLEALSGTATRDTQ